MFKPGSSGNPTGRPTGAKDKTQADIKQAYQTLVEGNLSNIETWLQEVATKDPGRAIELMLRLSEFFLPKMKAMELKTDFAEPFRQIIVVQSEQAKRDLHQLKEQLNKN